MKQVNRSQINRRLRHKEKLVLMSRECMKTMNHGKKFLPKNQVDDLERIMSILVALAFDNEASLSLLKE